MKLRFALSYLLVILSLTTCQKQSPDNISPDYRDSLSEVRRGEACRNVTLAEDILNYQNVVNLFACTEWDLEFPNLNRQIKKIKAEDWARIITPLDRILNNKEIRNNLVILFKSLDEENGLDDFGRVLTSLSDSNFYFHINQILEKAYKEDGLSVLDVENFFNVFKVDEKLISNLSKGFIALADSLSKNNESFVLFLREAIGNNGFKKLRNGIVSQFFKGLSKKDSKETLSFYSNAFYRDNKEGWLVAGTKAMDKEPFLSLVEFPAKKRETFYKDFNLLKVGLLNKIPCRGLGNPNDPVVDLDNYIRTTIDQLFEGDHKTFLSGSLQTISILKFADEVCPNVTSIESIIDGKKHKLAYDSLLKDISHLLVNESKFKFVQEMVGVNIDSTFLIDYFSDLNFKTVLDLIQFSSENQIKLSEEIYSLLRNLELEGSIAFSETFILLQKQNSDTLISFSKVWDSLGEDGQFFIFNFLDEHYKNEKTDPVLLFTFYGQALEIIKKDLPQVLNDILDEGFVESVFGISENLKGEDVKADFQRFFSRDHLLEVLRIVSTTSIEKIAPLSLKNTIVTKDEVKPDLTISDLPLINEKILTCFLSVENLGLYSLINDFPSECNDEVILRDPLLKIISGINNFSHYKKNKYGPSHDVGNKGFFGADIIENLIAQLSEYNKKEKNKIVATYEALEDWLKNENNSRTLVNFFENLNQLAIPKHDFMDIVSKFYGTKANFEYIGNVAGALKSSLSLFKDYKSNTIPNLTKNTFWPDEKYSCANYTNNLGGVPCPNSEQLTFVLNDIIRRALIKYDTNPNAIEAFVKAFSSSGGINIPFEASNQKIKKLTLSETLSLLWDLSDPNESINKKKVDFFLLPMADELFFKSTDWNLNPNLSKPNEVPSSIVATTLERVEGVVKEVRFDENYLGAHYMNSVAKSTDYNNTVGDKFDLLKFCVPLKFCGKFMNRTQHYLAQNGRDNFTSLLDVNTHSGWRYGDYMQALLTAIVSSSSDESQVSSVINRKILGVNINIPWLLKKEVLKKHNGKILTDITMVNGFSNASRVLRDRLRDDGGQIDSWLNSPFFKHINENLFKGFNPSEHQLKLEELISTIVEKNLVENLVKYGVEQDYTNQRLWEQLPVKILYLGSFIGTNEDRYSDLTIFDWLPLLKIIVENYDQVVSQINFNSKDTLLKINHFLDVIIYGLQKNDNRATGLVKLINEVTYFIKFSDELINPTLASLIKEGGLKELISLIDNFESLYSSIDLSQGSFVDFVEFLEETKISEWTAVQEFLERNGAQNVCVESDGATSCSTNTEYRDLQNLFGFLTDNRERGLINLIQYIKTDEDSRIPELLTKIFQSL